MSSELLSLPSICNSTERRYHRAPTGREDIAYILDDELSTLKQEVQ